MGTLTDRIPTPCIGVCSTGIGDSVCRGCKRFAHEIIAWNGYSTGQKRIIDQRLDHFLTQVVTNKLVIVDADRLRLQLEQLRIRYPRHRGPGSWVFALLRAGASQIDRPADFGLQRQPGYEDWSMLELREAIDREWFELSEAHYDRYIRAPHLRASPPKGDDSPQ